MVLFLLLAIIALVAGQPIPSRNFTAFSTIAKVPVPGILDNGFRVGNVVYWGLAAASTKGSSSLLSIDLTTNEIGSFALSQLDIQATQKFIKGWAVPGKTDESIMLINSVAEGVIGRFKHSYSYSTSSVTEPNCIEDEATSIVTCNGTITHTVTELVSRSIRQGNFLDNSYLQMLGGQIDWSRNRGYFVSVNSNPNIVIVNMLTLTEIQVFKLVDPSGVETGQSKRTQISEDGTILYILTSTNRFYRIFNISTNPVTDFVMQFPTKFLPLSFIVSDRYKEALFTTQGFPSVLCWVDLEQERIYETKIMSTLFSPAVILKDAAAGFAYAVGFGRPSVFVRVNLETHDTDQLYSSKDPGRSQNGFIDTATSTIYLAAQRMSLAVRYPGACLGSCSGHGTCGFGGVCVCDAGWQGDACDYMECPSGQDRQICSGNGRCLKDGTCGCFPGYKGEECETFTCSGDCSGHGTCDEGIHKCTCDPGYTESDCSVSLLDQCESATTCSDCSKSTLCVWCESNSSCIFGDINGPLIEYCERWHYRTCNFLGFRVVGYLFVAICFFFLILNAIFTVIEDHRGPEAVADKANFIRSLWIHQRDVQTWYMIEQMQIAALLAYLATPFPSNFKTFTDALGILLLSTIPPWQTRHLPYLPNRQIVSLTQTAVTQGTHPADLMAGSMFVFLLMIGAVIIYGVLALISQNKMALWRTTHILIRVCQFAQPGLCALGAYTVTQINQEHYGAWNWGFSIASAFISIIGLGVLFPLFALLFVTFNKAALFEPSTLTQFGGLYEIYHHDKLWFGAVQLFKTACIAMFIGFFADETSGWHSPLASMVLPMIVITIFIVCTMVARPFIDKFRGIVQVFMLGIFDIFIFGLCIVYLQFENYDGWAVGVAAIVGGTLFFTIIMWFMNQNRIGKYVPSKEGDSGYVRM